MRFAAFHRLPCEVSGIFPGNVSGSADGIGVVAPLSGVGPVGEYNQRSDSIMFLFARRQGLSE